MTRKEFLQRLHRKSGRPFVEAGAWLALFFALMAGSILAWETGYWPVTVVCWLIQAHIGTVLWDSVEAKKNATADDPWSTKWQASNFAGHGPWKLTQYIAGESWTFERNPNYYDPARYTGNVTKVINRVIPSSANRVALVQSGAIDMAFDLQASELVRLQNAPGVRVDSLIGNHLQWLGFSFNTEVGKPLQAGFERMGKMGDCMQATQRAGALHGVGEALGRHDVRF